LYKMTVTTFTWDDLLRFGFITAPARDLLLSALAAPVNLLITGGAGAGKTTFANALASSLPADQRLVVAKPVQEFRLQHPRAIFLEAGGPANIPFAELISTASKMRPDWLIIGEMIGPEAMRVMEVLSRGHTAMATLHANSPEDALARLEALCLMANLGLGLGEIRALIASALRAITCQRRLPNGKRRLMQIVELCGLDNNRYVLQPLFRYNLETGRLEATGATPGWA
jgi:pilus assembly protein CpaF